MNTVMMTFWVVCGILSLSAGAFQEARESFLWGGVWGALIQLNEAREKLKRFDTRLDTPRRPSALPYLNCTPKNLGWGRVPEGIEITNLPDGTTWHSVLSSESEFIRVLVETEKGKTEWYADFEDETHEKLKLAGRVPISESRL